MCETYTQPYRRTLTDNQIHDIALAIATKKMSEESWNDVTEYDCKLLNIQKLTVIFIS